MCICPQEIIKSKFPFCYFPDTHINLKEEVFLFNLIASRCGSIQILLRMFENLAAEKTKKSYVCHFAVSFKL